MADFRSESYTVGDQTYEIVTGELADRKAVLAVTDTENDIHYVSEGIYADSQDMMRTATVPDGAGVPDVVDAPMRLMDEIMMYIQEGEKEGLDRSLARLGDEVLCPDSQRERPEGKSSRQARKKMEMYDFEASPQDI